MGDEGTAAAPATLLTAVRAGASDKYLQTSAGQLADSGTPDYAYDGTSGSVAVTVDATDGAGNTIGAGDSLGQVYMLDSITGVQRGTVVGSPSTIRGGAIDSGSASDYIDAIDLSDVDGLGNPAQTVSQTVTINFATDRQVGWRFPTGGDGFQLQARNNALGQMILTVLKAGATEAQITVTGLTALYDGVPLQVFLSYDGANAIGAVYTAGGALVGSGTGSGTAIAPGLHTLCGPTNPLSNGSLERPRAWTTALSLAQMGEVAAGTDDHSPALDGAGLYGGCSIADPAVLVSAGGTGGDVVAQ